MGEREKKKTGIIKFSVYLTYVIDFTSETEWITLQLIPLRES